MSGGVDKPHEQLSEPFIAPTPSPAPLPVFTPSSSYELYCTVLSGLSAAWRRFVAARWRVLLPLYRRVDLPGLRGFAVVELLVIACYLLLNALYLLPHLYNMLRPRAELQTYMVSMVQSAYRLGTVGTWNVLALWLPVTRHSVWNHAIGISFDRSIWYHVWVSRLALFILALHAGGLYAWMLWKQELLQELLAGGFTGKVPSGELAMLGGLLLLVTSIQLVRRRWWELFLRCHYVGLLLFTVFSALHDRMVVKVALAGVALYGLDLLLRCLHWTRPVQLLDLRVLDGDVTRIEWRLQGFRFEAGQFVLLCIPAVSPFEWHPYSLSSSPHQPTCVVHSQQKGEWTRRLQQLAQSFDASRPCSLYVEGPYGSLSVPLRLYRHVLLVSGGMGVTPMLSTYNCLQQQRHHGGEQQQLAAVAFVWTMRDRRLLRSVWRDTMRLQQQQQQQQQHSPQRSADGAVIEADDSTSLRSIHIGAFPSSPRCDPMPSVSSPAGFSTHFHVTSSLTGDDGGSEDWHVSRGRPRLSSHFADMKRSMLASAAESGRHAVRRAGLRPAIIDRPLPSAVHSALRCALPSPLRSDCWLPLRLARGDLSVVALALPAVCSKSHIGCSAA